MLVFWENSVYLHLFCVVYTGKTYAYLTEHILHNINSFQPLDVVAFISKFHENVSFHILSLLYLALTLPVPILSEERKLAEIFIFTLFCGAS